MDKHESTVTIDIFGEHWLLDGKYHRENGPAHRDREGYAGWYQHGKCHRMGGPARIWAVGKRRREEWWVRNDDITEPVERWISDNELPPWREWDDEVRALFVLRFSR